MIDELRAWRADPEDEVALQQLEGACERAGQLLPWDALLATPRWRWLERFARGFCEAPLTEVDGANSETLAEGRGAALPRVLREWHALVGARALEVGDGFRPIEELAGEPDEDERVFYRPPHRGWVAGLASADDDPLVTLRFATTSQAPAILPSLSAFLRELLASDAIHATSQAAAEGLLGPFPTQLDSGWDSVPPELSEAALPLVDHSWHAGVRTAIALSAEAPFIVELEERTFLWVAPPAGEERLRGLVPLNEAPKWTLELWLDDERPGFFAELELAERLQEALGERLDPGSTLILSDRVLQKVTTTTPREDAARVRAVADGALRVVGRPINRGRWREL